MLAKPPRGLFITGTNTGVGKTYVACLIARRLVAEGTRVGVYKPAASGCIEGDGRLVSEDAFALWEAAGRPGELHDVCPQRFRAPLAPHLAARAEGKEIDVSLLRSGLSRWRGRCDVVLVEGAGGLMSPLSDDDYVADLVYEFGYPLVIVAPNVLGVINQTLQTLVTAAAFADGLQVAGVVLNSLSPNQDDPSSATNLAELKKRCGPPVLTEVDPSGGFTTPVDWLALSGGDRSPCEEASLPSAEKKPRS
jgi:dethiobiotin synthetase